MRACRPPRSLYTDLPRRFCMRRTDEAPRFLSRNRSVSRALHGLEERAFYTLDGPERETSPCRND